MRRGGGAPGKDGAGEGGKVMGPLFPRLHVNDTTLKGGGPRAPPRNKMALYEQFSVPSSQRFAPAAHRPAAAAAASDTASYAASAGQIGGSDRPLFPSFCVPSNEPVRSSNSNGRDGGATRVESGRLSTQLKSKDTYAAGSTAECSSQRRENNTKNSSGKRLTNDDDFMVPSVFCSGVPHPAREEVRIQEKSTPLPAAASPYKSGPAASKSSAKYSNTDKRFLEGMDVSDARSKDSPNIKDKAPARTTTNLEVGSSFRLFSTKTGKTDDKVSLYRDKLSSINVSDKQHSRAEGHQAARRRDENTAESQNAPIAGNGPYSTGIGCNGASNMSEKGLRETGEKRKRSTGHHNVQKDDSSDDSSVESLPGLEISPDDVVGAIGPKHFWKARRAIVNQQRVFAVQVFELHRLIKVQKLIAASPHLLIEGDPCLGTALVTSKKKLAAASVEKQLSSAKSKDDDAQLTLQQPEYSKDNTEENQDSLSQDDDVVEVQQNNPDASNCAASSIPPTMPAPPDNKQNNWCAPPPPNQWLVPVMSPSEGLVYKPYTGPCPPAGSFLAPFYASCTPVSLPSTAGDFMASPYGIPMPHHHQPQHMGGPPPMPPMYFPPFSMPVMNNPVVSASAVEQVSSRVAPARPNAHVEHLSRTSCNMRNEAVSGGIWRFHSSARDSKLQGSSAASSPFDRQQGEARGPAAAPPPPLPTSSAGNGGQQPQPSSGSKENPAARVIRVVPHTARTASESAARIFRSIQMERRQNDP